MIVEEGSAKIDIKVEKKVSADMQVFYNPVMKLNRDISVALINSIKNKDMRICLPMEASGMRGIRFIKELKKGKVESIVMNDISKEAFDSMKNNVKLNKVESKIILKNEDANLLILNSEGFDYIDIDPFGCPNFLLDSAVKRISRDGILAVTATDTSALSGTFINACQRKYFATPKKDYKMHERGLRILIRKIQLIGAQYDKALLPIYSYSTEHYMRTFLVCTKGKTEVDNLIKQHKVLENAGPFWTGQLWDEKIASNLEKEYSIPLTKTIKEESKINSLFFIDTHYIGKKFKFGSLPKLDDVMNKIKESGAKASRTHFLDSAIRTNLQEEKAEQILLSLVKK